MLNDSDANLSKFPMIPERRSKVKKLRELFDRQSDGATISWLEIERDTGISMGASGDGRDLARTALHLNHRPYVTLHGSGIELSSPTNAVDISLSVADAVSSAMQVGKRRVDWTLVRHAEAMEADVKRRMLAQSGLLASTRLAMQLEQKLLKK